MEFQLFKQASIGTYTLPRVGVLADLLDDQIAPMYAENDAERPELAATARFLAEHYREMDPETKLFTSMSATTPDTLINKRLLRFSKEDVAALTAAIPNSSIELGQKQLKTLLSIVISESIGIAFSLEIRSNPDVLLASKTQPSIDGRIIRTAASKDDPDVHSGPGRKVRHIPWQRSEAKGPSTRDIRDIYSMLAYTSAFNAFVGGKAIDKDFKKADFLSQLALNFETSKYFDSILGSVGRTLSTGAKVKLADGTPLTPNPPVGAFFGADHRQFFAAPDGPIPNTHPTSILQVISHGAAGNNDASFMPYAHISRKALYGEQLAISEDGSDIEEKNIHAYTGIAARASLKSLAGLYSGAPDKMHSDLSDVLLRGFTGHLALIRANGISLDKYQNIVPSLKDEKVASEIKKSLVRIIASLPQSFASFEEAKTLSKKAIEGEHARLAAAGLGSIPFARPANTQFSNFIDFVAQLVLKLPINFSASLQSFDPRGMLRPIPPFHKVSVSGLGDAAQIFDAGFDPSFDDVFKEVVAGNASGGAAGFAYNTLSSSKPMNDFFIACGRSVKGVDKDNMRGIRPQLTKLVNAVKLAVDKFETKSKTKEPAGDSAKLISAYLSAAPENKRAVGILLVAGLLVSIGVSPAIDFAGIYDYPSTNASLATPAVAALIKDVASRLPPSWNEADDSRVESDYNNINEYRKNNKNLYENPDSPIEANNSAMAKLHLMHEGSFNNALHMMLSNGLVAKYDQNKAEHDAYVEANYRLPEIDSSDVPRALDIDSKVAEMVKDKVLESFIKLDKTDAQKDLFVPGTKPTDREILRKREVGFKFQAFFNEWSKESIISQLYKTPRTPTSADERVTYGADYFDAFNVLLAQRFHMLFENHINSYLEAKDIGARATVGDKSFSAEEIKELQASGKEEGENTGAVKQTDRYTSFAAEWATRPKFAKQNGGFDTQSLAGFMAECLTKKDIAKRGGVEGAIAAKFVDRLVMPLDAKRFKSKDANVPILGLVMNRAIWAYGRITQGKNNAVLNRILSDNVILGKPGLPTTAGAVVVRINAFVDPVVSAESLAKGNPVDTRYKCMQRAMARISSEYDNYEDWEIDVAAYMRSARQETERKIAELNASPELKAAMNNIVAQSAISDQMAWRMSAEDIATLTEAGRQLTSIGEIKNEVLWKNTFQYALPAVTAKIKSYISKDADADKVTLLAKGNKAIKSVWQIYVADLLGPAGIIEKSDDEKYAIAVAALGMVLDENVNLLTMSSEEAAVEVASIAAESSATHDDADEADIATDAAESKFLGTDIDIRSTLEDIAQQSDTLQVLMTAAKAGAPDFDDVLSDPDEDKEAYIEKIFSREMLNKTKPGQAYITSCYLKKINVLSQSESLPSDIEKQLDKAMDLKKSDLLAKMPLVAPKIHADVMQDIDRNFSTIKTEISAKMRMAEPLMQIAEKAAAVVSIQRSTAHMADIQRLVYAGSEIAMSRAPILPTSARYKMAIEGFLAYNEGRVNSWNASLMADPALKPFIKFDDKLRQSGFSIDRVDEKVLRTYFNEESDIAFASDSVVRRLFAVRTSVIEKVKLMSDLKLQLENIKDDDIDKFHEQLASAEKEFGVAQKKNIGIDATNIIVDEAELGAAEVITDEDISELTDEDLELLDAEDADIQMIDESLSDVEDAEGRAISKNELAKRQLDLKALNDSVMSIRAMLARFKVLGQRPDHSKTTSGDVFLYFGTEVLGRIKSAIDAPTFIGNNSDEHIKEMIAVMRDMRDYFGGKTGTMHPLSAAEEETLNSEVMTAMQGFLDKFGEILDRPIPRPELKEFEAGGTVPPPLPAKVVRRQTPGEPVQTAEENGLIPVGSPLEQELNAEITSAGDMLRAALKAETQATPARRSVLENTLILVNAFAIDNRDFDAEVKIRDLIKFVESAASVANDADYDHITPEAFKAHLQKLQGAGFKLKKNPEFKGGEKGPVKSAAHTRMMAGLDHFSKIFADEEGQGLAQLINNLIDNPSSGGESVMAAKSFLKEMASITQGLENIRKNEAAADERHAFDELTDKHLQIPVTMAATVEKMRHKALLAIHANAFEGFLTDKEVLSYVEWLKSATWYIANFLSKKVAEASAENPRIIKTSEGWSLG